MEVTTHHVVKNIRMGIALVVSIQWLFLGDLRCAIVVGATIPFALFTAVLVMRSGARAPTCPRSAASTSASWWTPP